MTNRVLELHNIMPVANVSSVLEHGILSHERCSKLPHIDVSMAAIQERRDKIQVPGGLKLHRYANLYFDARNPMMSKRRGDAPNLCVLKVSVEVLGLDGAVIADQNASSKYVRFLSPTALDWLDFDKIYAEDWRHPDDQIEYWRHKSMKCAEVLVPNRIDSGYIMGAYVSHQGSETMLRNQGFPHPVEINPKLFFC